MTMFDLSTKTLAAADAADLFSASAKSASDDAAVLDAANALRGAAIGTRAMLSLADDLGGRSAKTAKSLLNNAAKTLTDPPIALEFVKDSVVMAKKYVKFDDAGENGVPTHIAFEIVTPHVAEPMSECTTADCTNRVRKVGMCKLHRDAAAAAALAAKPRK